jgi:hypothetical protein
MRNNNRELHEDDLKNQKIRNCQFTKASFAKPILEGEGDAFQVSLKT